jgi:hypothetical protein
MSSYETVIGFNFTAVTQYAEALAEATLIAD